jgi:hypothetical protein
MIVDLFSWIKIFQAVDLSTDIQNMIDSSVD